MSDEHPTGVLEDEALYAAAVGPNQDYYLPRFRKFARGGWISWNWAAFFATAAWLHHRKLHTWAALYMLVSVPFLVWWLPSERPESCIGEDTTQWRALAVAAIAGIMLIVPPLIANRLYFGRVRRLVSRSPGEVPRKGGTDSLASPLVVQAVVLVIGLFELPDRGYYMLRAKIIEGAAIVQLAAADVQRYQAAHGGQLPARLEDATPYRSGGYVDRVDLAADGSLRATFNKAAGIAAGHSVSMEAAGKSGDTTIYRCVSDNLAGHCLPPACKGR